MISNHVSLATQGRSYLSHLSIASQGRINAFDAVDTTPPTKTPGGGHPFFYPDKHIRFGKLHEIEESEISEILSILAVSGVLDE
jgi:hypothetical protein